MYSSEFEVSPKTLDEVYSAYRSVESSVIVGGAWGLKHDDDRHFALAIKLGNLGLDFIRETEGEIIIGAMTTLQTLEKAACLQGLSGGVLPACIREIKNRDMKSAATIGGVLACKHRFSLILPVLLALNVDVYLQAKGCMSLSDYLPCPPMGELITQVVISKEKAITTFAAQRKSPEGMPCLTGAVTMCDDVWRIVIGGRPGIAAMAENASSLLSAKGMAERENAAHVASEEMDFADDAYCSEGERRKLAVQLVRDMIKRTWKGYSRLAH